MAATNSSKFYKEKGLVRTSITLRPETIQTLENMAKQHKLTQGEIVDAFARLLESGNLSDQEKIAEKERRKELKKKALELIKSGQVQ
ncbi:hypothetical protein [Acinetobacter baumannii]|uniref:hypothetical protein n=1 Tax=Acinetobacter baumannii TaxID=470 RepID=UPI000DE593F6|nr:hypothetical protein [Acinetobacter baumannii]